MKKNFNRFAWLGAIALAGTLSFTACSTDDEPAISTSDEGVKVAFSFNLGNLNQKASTRQTSDVTQQGGNVYNGMHFWIYNFAATPTDNTAVIKTTNELFKEEALSKDDITARSNDGTDSHKEYLMSIPVKTKHFLFYGVGDNSITSGTDLVKNESNGMLTTNFPAITSDASKTTDDISFSLVKIDGNFGSGITSVTDAQTALAGYMTNIATANITNTTTTIYWKDMADADDQHGLGLLYRHFTAGINDYAGSANDILNVVNDLKDNLILFAKTNTLDANESAMLAAIQNAITGANFQFESGITWENATSTDKLSFQSTTTGITNFPEAQGLPSGSMQLVWNTSGVNANTFTYKTSGNLGGSELTTVVSLNYADINFPARLMYYANSGLYATTDDSKGFQNTVSSWSTADNWSEWTGTEVTLGTKKVAMKNNVQYGTALLESKVRIKFASGTQFEDNRANVVKDGSDANQKFNIKTGDTATGLTFKGIVIGGQPGTVGWQFLPKGSRDKMIYDNNFASDATTDMDASSTTFTSPLYTLVLDNFASEADSQDQVKVAVELVNNTGTDFYGYDGVVKNGATFYLLGVLDAADTDDGGTAYGNLTWATYQPGTGPADGNTVPRVFIQDKKTVAEFTISETSLQRAYNVIPDLLSTQMVFGLSVDLQWENAYTFKIDL